MLLTGVLFVLLALLFACLYLQLRFLRYIGMLFIPYTFLLWIQTIYVLSLIIPADPPHYFDKTLLVGINLITIIEFITCISYIKITVASDTSSRFLLFLLQIFPLTVCYTWIYADTLDTWQPPLYICHFLLMGIGISTRYIENIQDATCLQYPTYRMIKGLMIFSTIQLTLAAFMLPYTDAGRHLNTSFFIIRSSAYILLFILLFAAFKSHKALAV